MMRNHSKKLASGFAGLLTAVLLASPAFAVSSTTTPTGGTVTAGDAKIKTIGATEIIAQKSNTALIDWSSYNVGQYATVNYIQPSSKSITINRINPNSGASQIYGTINANGIIVLSNGSGINFKSGSHVNVGGLVATASRISNDDYNRGVLTGIYKFTPGENPKAQVLNSGTITVKDGGLVALVAPTVQNTSTGTINARLGKVQLGSGDTFGVDLTGDGLLNLQASDAITEQVINQTGKIYADGGTVELTAAAAKNVVDSQINMKGLIQADTVGTKNGKIVLTADVIEVDGLLYTRGECAKGEKAGSIMIDGEKVSLCNCSKIDATGKVGSVEGQTGQVTIKADALEAESGLSIKTNENVTFDTHSADTSIGVAGGEGKLQLSKVLLDGTEAGSVTIGNTSKNTGDIHAAAYTWDKPVKMLSKSGDIYIDGVQTMKATETKPDGRYGYKHHGDRHHGGYDCGHGDCGKTSTNNTFLANTVTGDITIGEKGGVVSSAKGDAVVLAASGGKFVNKAGSNAVQTPKGRWLIYSNNPDADTFGGLDSGNTAIWATTYNGSSPSKSGNRYIFVYAPTLTLTPDDMSKKYGVDNTVQVAGDTYRVDGLHPGVAGAFKGDTLGDVLSGTAAITSTGSPAPANPGKHNIDMTGMTAGNGYNLVYAPGTLTVGDKPSDTPDFPPEAILRGTRGGKKGPYGTLLSIVNNQMPTNLADLAPAAGGNVDVNDLPNLAPTAGGNMAAGGGSSITPLIQCTEAAPCEIAQ